MKIFLSKRPDEPEELKLHAEDKSEVKLLVKLYRALGRGELQVSLQTPNLKFRVAPQIPPQPLPMLNGRPSPAPQSEN